jgi:iron-sulfur cluster assembly accessory protein
MIISGKAAEHIIALAQVDSDTDDENYVPSGLRIKVTGGGCSGLMYKITMDSQRKGDKVFTNGAALLLVDRKSYLYVHDSEVIFSEELVNAGFKVANPNTKSTCGCGESFVV